MCLQVKSSGIVKDIGGKRELDETDGVDGPPAKRKQRYNYYNYDHDITSELCFITVLYHCSL